MLHNKRNDQEINSEIRRQTQGMQLIIKGINFKFGLGDQEAWVTKRIEHQTRDQLNNLGTEVVE